MSGSKKTIYLGRKVETKGKNSRSSTEEKKLWGSGGEVSNGKLEIVTLPCDGIFPSYPL